MRKLFVLFCAIAAVALSAEVTGKWTGEMQGRKGKSQTTTLDLKADGDKLTGTAGARGRQVPISDGKVDGDNVSFKVKRTMGDNEMVILYKGKVSADELKLTMSMEGRNGSREITLKRAK